jgi:hypothetical protein
MKGAKQTMVNNNDDIPIRGVNRQIGFAAGAALGALLRLLVGLAFVYCVQLLSNEDASELYLLAFASAVIGLFVGGAGGVTCKPKLGATIGASLSGVACVGLVLMPAGLAALATAKPSDRIGPVALGFIGGLIAMTIAGAVAGGVGAWVGHRSVKPPRNTP